MTCIVGIAQQGKIFMGADSAASTGDSARIRKESKIIRGRNMLVGVSGAGVLTDIIEYNLGKPLCHKNIEARKYLCAEFVPLLRQTLAVFEIADDGASFDGEILVGLQGRMFTIQGDYQVGELYQEYTAIGSGQDYAMGSLHSTASCKCPLKRLTKALRASAEFCNTVRAPFSFEVL
jgi:ATP-dependent protease HslVU (ClpYQ) peptidase subunit